MSRLPRRAASCGVDGMLLVAQFAVLEGGSSDEKTNEPKMVARAGRSFMYGSGGLCYL